MASKDTPAGTGLSDAELDDLVASSDTGGRSPTNRSLYLLMAGLALAWSLFQLWFASPIPSILSQYESTRWIANMTAFNSGEARSIHLAFAILLCFLSYPAFKDAHFIFSCSAVNIWAGFSERRCRIALQTRTHSTL